jgi:hypothetical protein
VGMVKRTPEAEGLLAQLDSELAASAERRGYTLSWTAAEGEHRRAIADTVDRRVWLQGRLANVDPTDTKNVVRLSCEIRQCDVLVSRLLKLVCTDDVAAPTYYQSQASRRAQHVARKRWSPGAVS